MFVMRLCLLLSIKSHGGGGGISSFFVVVVVVLEIEISRMKSTGGTAGIQGPVKAQCTLY